MIQVVQRFKKKPPNKLKPLGKILILLKKKILSDYLFRWVSSIAARFIFQQKITPGSCAF